MARRTAVITGASSGIGAVFAQRLAAEHDLLLIARRKDRLESLAAALSAKYGSSVKVVQADLTSEHDLQVVADEIAAASDIALLVNNAGFGTKGLFWQTNLEEQERMHRLHIIATVRLSHVVLQKMVKNNSGGIINVASVSAFVRRSGSASYGATKNWMTAFTEALYLELKGVKSAVKVQALCPGFTYSEFHDAMKADRGRIAPPSLWLRAEYVVDESLRALPRGEMFVIPGWRYKAIVALATKLPTSMRLTFEAAGTKKKSGSK